jgi:hypothetical protein
LEMTGQAMPPSQLSIVRPEDFSGEAILPSADVFGLGVLTYQLLAGISPYGDDVHSIEDLKGVLQSDVSLPLHRLQGRHSEITEDGDVFLMKCLQRISGVRPATAGHFLRGIHHLVMVFADAHPDVEILGELWHRLVRGISGP